MFEVQMQYVPGSDAIWVTHLKPSDPMYQYDNEAEAQAKATELQDSDLTGRKYRVVKIK
jgi:hypothetical protein